MEKSLLLLLLTCCLGTLYAQQKVAYTGRITDINKLPIQYATINADDGAAYAITNEKGNFELQLTKGSHIIKVEFLGYQSIVTKVMVEKASFNNNYTLKESSQGFEAVTIEAETKEEKKESQIITVESISLENVEAKINIITDEIEKASGVRVRRSGSLGDNAQITLNGLSGNAVRTFIDGIPLEFLYPGQNIANIPLTDIENVEIYKGVLPSELSADALGGGINLITKRKDKNKLKASYSLGSFNTHRGNLYLNLVDRQSNFINFSAGIDYSDNDYTFKAPVIISNPFDSQLTPIAIGNFRIKRFHDLYRQQYSSVSLGTYAKKWTDEASLNFNYQRSHRQINNNFRINEIAIGEATDRRENIALIAKYKKALFNNHWKIGATGSYSEEIQTFKDTSRNVYNWLGQVIRQQPLRGAEFTGANPVIRDNTTVNWSTRLTSNLKLFKNHFWITSFNYNKQERDLILNRITRVIEAPTQVVKKQTIASELKGSAFNKKLEYFGGGKFYNFEATLTPNTDNDFTFKNSDDFFGFFTGLKYKPFNNLTLRGSYERAILSPTIFQLAGDPPNLLPNPGLNPEESDNINAGIIFRKRVDENFRLKADIGGYYRYRRKEIFLTTSGPNQQFVNFFDTKTRGIEAELELEFLKKVKFVTDVTVQEKILDKLALPEEGNNFEVDPREFGLGTPVPNTPSFFYDIELNYNPTIFSEDKIKTSFYTLFNYSDTFNFLGLGGSNTKQNSPERFVFQQNRWDMGCSIELIKYNITAAFNARNILDEELFDNFSIPRAGRSFDIKLIYELDKF